VWHERDASAGVPWVRLVAAVLLGTVTDALMRVVRAGAHLVLLSYRLPVKRKVSAVALVLFMGAADCLQPHACN
jgi:hypothetical protein